MQCSNLPLPPVLIEGKSKMFVRAVAVSLLALFAVVQGTSQASADHRLRLRVLWPKIYAPRISGYLYRDELDDEDDEDFFDLEDEEEYIARHRKDRNIVLDLDEDDLEPVYEPPRPAKRLKAKAETKSADVKKTAKKPGQQTAVIKPKAKPEVKSAAVASVQPSSTVKASAPVIAAVKPVVPQTGAPKVVPPASQVASAAPAAGSIGCSKGAEIVSGYGFTSVQPRSCTGSTYSFNASRATSAYLIKVAAATGEITDVQKLK